MVYGQMLIPLEEFWLHVNVRIHNHYDVHMGGRVLVSIDKKPTEIFVD